MRKKPSPMGQLFENELARMRNQLLKIAQKNRPSMCTWVSGQIKLQAREELSRFWDCHCAAARENYELKRRLERSQQRVRHHMLREAEADEAIIRKTSEIYELREKVRILKDAAEQEQAQAGPTSGELLASAVTAYGPPKLDLGDPMGWPLNIGECQSPPAESLRGES